MNSTYVIRGGEQGKARLSVLSRALRPSTLELLKAAGITTGMSCLDVGCGGGDVTMEMARLVGPEGRVLGIDIDPAKLELASQDAEREGIHHVRFRTSDAGDPGLGEGYDFVYARFLLSHLGDPLQAVRNMAGAVKQEGVVVVEDIDHGGIFSHPECPAVDRYVELYNAVVRSRGADPRIGPRLPQLLRDAGLRDIRVNLVQPVFMEGEAKRMHAITLENIAGAVTAAGLSTAEEIENTVRGIEEFAADPHTIVALPRIFQAWGYR